MGNQPGIQGILGVDTKNPWFTVERKGNMLYVYFGMALIEIVPDDKTKPTFKLLMGRLFNSGIKKKALVTEFGICYTTLKRWGDAIKSNDLETVERALLGPGAPLKITKEISAFIGIRFHDIYQRTHYGYSQTIRNEIKSIFNKDISSESLRPIFSTLKQSVQEPLASCQSSEKELVPCCESIDICDSIPKTAEHPAIVYDTNENVTRENFIPIVSEQKQSAQEPAPNCQSTEEKLAPCCESTEIEDFTKQPEPIVIPSDTDAQSRKGNRKYALIFQKTGEYLLCNHAGVLLFSSQINLLKSKVESHANLIVQWLMTILLGMVNIEQTKLIHCDSIRAMLGTFMKSLKQQRSHLMKLATKEVITSLLTFNMDLVKCAEYTDFYYDPHTKQYTGMQKILKGWCSGLKGVAKILNMDFIHTAAGDPVYIKHLDNFNDLRERFVEVIDGFRKIMKCDKKDVMTFIVDRGIYGIDVFKGIIEKKYLHLITWEKGYKRNLWDDKKVCGSFIMTRPRNHAHDLLRYEFSYIDQAWAKNNELRQIIVKAINPNNVKIEVSVLATDKTRSAEEIIRLIFKRWIQENDFKYLIRHFGINEITSYSSTPYIKLVDLVKDKEMTSGSYKAKELGCKDLQHELSKLLLAEHTKKTENAERQAKIKDLTARLEKAKEEISQEKKKVSRLETLIAEQYFRLDTNGKELLDAIKIIARNMFYQMLQPFKESYNNYRDDHTLFRNMTESTGLFVNNKDGITVILMPTASYGAAVRKTVESFLDLINLSAPVLPDGSNRKITFQLGEKSNNLFAISNGQKQVIT